MTEVFAVKPPRGRVVHLHVGEYQPGQRERQLKHRVAMCGIGIWPNGWPKMEHALAPMAEALRWTSLAPSETDPRPTWTWCRACIGHLVVLAGKEREVLTMLVSTLAGDPA